MKSLSIVVPILNEANLVKESFGELKKTLFATETNGVSIEVVIADAGSSDGSAELAVEISRHNGWKFKTERIKKPSIAKTILLGVDISEGDYILVLPIDCKVSTASLEKLFRTNSEYGGFEKQYVPSNLLLNYYCFFQNRIRLKVFKNLVWTNVIFAKKHLWLNENLFRVIGFMEDVVFSDCLKKQQLDFSLISEKVSVSSRLYYANLPILRIGINIFIMLLYRVGLKDAALLKKIYRIFKH